MNFQRNSWARTIFVLVATAMLLALTCCTKNSSAQTSTVDLNLSVKTPFRFAAYGDARFHDASDLRPSNPAVRQALVQAIADANPAFVCITGDIVYNGNDSLDWNVWDHETSIWRERKIPIYPVIGNHDLHGDVAVALGNYFQRFPELKNSRYYSVRAANSLILVLDSALPETTGPQGEWLTQKLDHVPADVDFVFVAFHHPAYTSSSDSASGGGHSARGTEVALAKMLEARQANARFRIVVFSGHVHNYERQEHAGVTYFVTGGGGARPYPIERTTADPLYGKEVNYHYLLVAVDHQQLTVTMNRMDMATGKAVWSQPDSIKITAPGVVAQAVHR